MHFETKTDDAVKLRSFSFFRRVSVDGLVHEDKCFEPPRHRGTKVGIKGTLCVFVPLWFITA